MTDFEGKLQDQLRAAENQLTPEIQRQLKERRNLALAREKKAKWPRFFYPVASMAIAVIVAFSFLFSPGIFKEQPLSNSPSSDIATTKEDLDFYYWLAQTQSITET